MLAASTLGGLGVAWFGFHGSAGFLLWGVLVCLVLGASWVAQCGAPPSWRFGVLALNLAHVPLLQAALGVFGKSFPIGPVCLAVAVAGLATEGFRWRRTRILSLCIEPATEASPPQGTAPVAVEKGTAPVALEKETAPVAVEKETAPVALEKETDPVAVEKETDPVAVEKETAPVALEKETDPVAVEKETAPVAVEKGTDPVVLEKETAPVAVEKGTGTSQERSPGRAVEKPKPAQPIREECTVVFCELANHATLVNALPPGEFADLINSVLEAFQSMTEAWGGRCDRLGSDGMRAFFRGGEQPTSHAELALQCTLAIRARLGGIGQKCELRSGHELDMRFGINTGEMVVAPFGVGTHSTLSVAGESAEWGVRLANTNLLYGSKILLGARTSALAADGVEMRPIDLLQRQLPPEPPEEVFELLALRGTLSSEALERLTRYREGVEHFRARRWREAAAALRAAQPPRQNDDAIDLLLHRIGEQEALAAYAVDGH